MDRPPGAHSEQGAVLVESAVGLIAVMIFLSLVIDYADLFGRTIDVAGAARSAVRAGTSTATTVPTDDVIIKAIVDKANGHRAIERIVVYKANSGDQGPPAICKTAETPPASENCNVYLPSTFDLNPTALAHIPASQSWPSTSRVAGTDYLGVWVKASRNQMMNFGWSPRVYSDYAVMRIDALSTPGTNTATGFATFGNSTNPPMNEVWCLGPDRPQGCALPRGPGVGGGGGGAST